MKELWIDTRLTEEEMNFLNEAVLDENRGDNFNASLAGNISKSELIKDKDNWFYETTLKKLTERMFYRDWNNYYRYHVEKEEPLPEFKLLELWVNYQKQHEFNPIHDHSGVYSFVVFMKIPTHWENQHSLPFSAHATSPTASDFHFVRSKKDSEICTSIDFPLSPEDEGRMLFFPATLHHQVYPFYECEEERVTISGNICLYDSNRLEEQEPVNLSGDAYEEKVQILKMLEQSVKVTKEELKMLEESL